jgi:hypothetical protein
MGKISIETIKEWVKENPNDFELGKKVRSFINKIHLNKKNKIKE